MNVTTETAVAALINGRSVEALRGRGIGCCRVYVVLSQKEHAKPVAAAAKKLGMLFQRKGHYGVTNAIYVGYDNCDGQALARGEAIASALRQAGIPAYRDEHGD